MNIIRQSTSIFRVSIHLHALIAAAELTVGSACVFAIQSRRFPGPAPHLQSRPQLHGDAVFIRTHTQVAQLLAQFWHRHRPQGLEGDGRRQVEILQHDLGRVEGLKDSCNYFLWKRFAPSGDSPLQPPQQLGGLFVWDLSPRTPSRTPRTWWTSSRLASPGRHTHCLHFGATLLFYIFSVLPLQFLQDSKMRQTRFSGV